MRLAILTTTFAAAFLLALTPAHADKAKASPPPKASTQTIAEQVVFSARGDAELIGRASRVRELPRTLDARDKAQVQRVAALFRAGRVDVGKSELGRWVHAKGNRLSVDDATATVLWVTREAVASRRADLVTAAERVQEVDNKVLVLEAAVADLKVAATKRRSTVVSMPGAQEADALRTESVSHVDLPSKLADAERAYEKAEAERASARDAFVGLQGASRGAITALIACVRVAIDRR